MQERRAPHQHVQVLRCHGGSLKFARRHGHIYIYDGELYIVRLYILYIYIFFFFFLLANARRVLPFWGCFGNGLGYGILSFVPSPKFLL